MSVSIMEALQNADYNLWNNDFPLARQLAARQLHNAVMLLEKGYDLEDEVESLLEQYGAVENVPEKED